MPTWKKYKIEEIASDIAMGPFGSNIKRENFVESGVPVIRGGNLNKGRFNDEKFVYLTKEKADSLKRSNAYPNELVFTHRGTIGQVGIIPNNKFERYVVSQSQMRLALNYKLANPFFIFYFFRSRFGQYELLKNSSQVGVPAIASPTASLKQVEINLPPLPTQQRIAEILGALDDKIELNLQMNLTLEEMAMAHYKHWFVDFGPFKDGEFVDSELGSIPKGWEVKKIGDIVETLGGGTPSTKVKEYWENGKIDWYSPTDLTRTNSLYSLGTEKKINELGLSKSSAKLFPPYSVLMSSRATIGAITINHKEACTNQGFITLIPNDKISIYQIIGWLNINMDEIISNANGSTFKEISKGNFRDFLIVKARNIENYINESRNIFDQIESNVIENQNLIQTRDYLLPKLINGEVEVKEAEDKIKEML